MYVEKDAHSFSKLPIAVCTLAYLLLEQNKNTRRYPKINDK